MIHGTIGAHKNNVRCTALILDSRTTISSSCCLQSWLDHGAGFCVHTQRGRLKAPLVKMTWFVHHSFPLFPTDGDSVRYSSDSSRPGVSLAATEDALFAGALVGGAEADQKSCLLVLHLLLDAAVCFPICRFTPRLGA